MRSLRERHPGAVCVYYVCAVLPVMFGLNPVTAGIGLAGAMAFLLALGERLRSMLLYIALPLISGILNPVFNHNGKTVLFFLNSNPVTAESVLYGLVMGLLIASALAWGRSFTRIMDTDRAMTVLGGLHPKAALVLSVALRYIPLLRRQAQNTREAAAGLGLIREDNGIDRIGGALRVTDGLVTWGLENGIVTADSMAARGYGTGIRTRYRLYLWERGDTALCVLSVLLLVMLVYARATGKIGYTWYPELVTPERSLTGMAAYAAFAALSFLAAILETGDGLKWKYLRSNI